MMSPEQILNRLIIREPREIEIEAIAQFFGATIIYERVDSCEARIVGDSSEAFISVNPCPSNRGRERFSAAHELGHWFKDRGKILACSMDAMIDWGQGREMRANRFAQELLLPLRMFKPRATGLLATVEAVRTLADQFTTSLTATAIRMVEHGPVPAIIGCYEPRGLRWFKRGPVVPDSFWLPKQPFAKTLTARALRGELCANGPKTWTADVWIEHPDAIHYEILEDCLLVAPETVVTLVSWGDDESQIIDLDDD